MVLERKARKKTNGTPVAIARKELEIRERKKKTEDKMTTKEGMEWIICELSLICF